MSTARRSIGIIAYAPAIERGDGRTLSVVDNLERALPGVRLAWEVSEEGRPLALPQRDMWLTEAAARGALPLLCNGDESYPVTIAAWATRPRLTPGGQALLEVHTEFPLDATMSAAAANALEGVGEGARALWGIATPDRAAVEIARQTSNPLPPWPEPPPRGLPALRPPEKIAAPEIPHCLGWLNYWSPAAAEAVGFPDPARDADLLARARRTAAGAWIVRLTDAPLDLDNPAHLDALLRAYDRFPAIGGRTAGPGP